MYTPLLNNTQNTISSSPNPPNSPNTPLLPQKWSVSHPSLCSLSLALFRCKPASTASASLTLEHTAVSISTLQSATSTVPRSAPMLIVLMAPQTPTASLVPPVMPEESTARRTGDMALKGTLVEEIIKDRSSNLMTQGFACSLMAGNLHE
ncbi:hypothetical protein EYC84_004429 [Monilinia fructicola]|uniref:Uncharacterized protein n=1 Tax=Monilinia fructicola TaxID=38448 RepID=A0A5M9K5E0_MONFR|nr:hypothetical protein EYC84_004429 [Monilinia fructicola]